MNDAYKPRIDFDGPLEDAKAEQFKTSQAFDDVTAEKFAPVTLDEEPEQEGQVEATLDAALRPKRSLWRKMVSAGLGLFGISVVAQGVQWTMTAWQTNDWAALGGCAAGALIVGAGVGSVVTEWRRLWRLRQRAEERDEARTLMHSHSVGKDARSARGWRVRRGWISHTRRYSAGTRLSTKPRATAKWSACTRIWCSRYWMHRRGVKSAVRRRNRL